MFALYHLRLAKIEILSKIAVKLMKLKGVRYPSGKTRLWSLFPRFTNQLPGNGP
jgi:hypothetical protein